MTYQYIAAIAGEAVFDFGDTVTVYRGNELIKTITLSENTSLDDQTDNQYNLGESLYNTACK